MTADELFPSIDAGNLEQVRAMLDAEPTLSSHRDSNGVSALMHALYQGHRPVAELIATHLSAIDIFEAASLGRSDDLAHLLLADPSRATAWSVDGFTALHFAAFFGGGEAARVLLDAGADPNLRSRNDFDVLPIHSAVAGRHGDVVAALLDAGADPNVRQRHGWTPLHSAAEHGDTATVERLLTAGADPGAVNDEGVTAADLARTAGHEAMADRFSALAAGATSTG
jgi:uncharacterized protein